MVGRTTISASCTLMLAQQPPDTTIFASNQRLPDFQDRDYSYVAQTILVDGEAKLK